MDIQLFCDVLGLSEHLKEKIVPHWDTLLKNSSDSFPHFMEESFWKEYYPLCAGPSTDIMFPEMAEVAAIVRENPAAARYASILQFVNFYASDELMSLPWESPEKLFGKQTGIFQLMIAMSALPEIRKVHAEMGLPESFMHGTADWIRGAIGIYMAGHDGVPGFNIGQIYWVGFTLKKKIFRIGRLEYFPQPYSPEHPAVYRNRKTKRLAVFCRDGWAFDEKLQRVDPEKTVPAFTTHLRFLNNSVTGTPVTADGYPVRNKEIMISLDEWDSLCNPWEDVITMHIPGGGGMTLESVRESLIQAREFYKKYFQWEVKMFTCISWILNPAWQEELPDSNFAKLQRNVYMTPAYIADGGNPGLFFVYGDAKCDPLKREQTTSLHKAICRILARGEYLKSGCLILPADDLEQIGTEYFRKTYC